MEAEKLSKGQIQVAATGFLSLFSLIGIMFYGLPFFFDFWVKDFGWSRATVTSGMAFSKVIIGPLFGFFAGWIIDRFGPRRLMHCFDWLKCHDVTLAILYILFVQCSGLHVWRAFTQSGIDFTLV